MPYSITRGKGCSPSKPWGVVKDSDGTVVACHATKESALAQIRALYAVEPALAKARARMEKHLPHQHDQQKHGTGGTSAPDSAPKKRNKKDIAGDDQRAAELYASGKTWDEVATEMGYANGGVARRAGKRHEERAKDKPADDGATKPKTEDVTPPTPVITPPVTPTPMPVDIVNPRPMTGEDRSQQTVPTDDINVARETGRPYAPFTDEGASPQVKEAIAQHQKATDAYDDHYKTHFEAEMDRRIAADKKASDDFWDKKKAVESSIPRKPGEDYIAHSRRVEAELARQGIKRPEQTASEAKIVADGLVKQKELDTLTTLADGVSESRERTRATVQNDTAEHLLGAKLSVQPVMVTDWDAPWDRSSGQQRPMKQDTSTDFSSPKDPVTGKHRQIPRTQEVFVTPDGKQIERWQVFRDGDGADEEFAVIRETSRARLGQIDQAQTRQRLIDGDGDGKFNERLKEQVRRQQAIVDSPHTRIVLHAPVSAVGGIVTSGRFKSQLETGRTKGFKGKTTREGFEGGTMGVIHPPDDKSRAPIYGALHLGGVRPPEAVGAEQYGEIGFVLKRSTHERALFTEGDSLNMCYEPSRLTGTQTRPNGHMVNGGVDYGRGFKGDRDSPEEFATQISPAPRRARGYSEAQVLGGVTMSDVEYVTVPKGTKLPEATRRKLTKAGIPIVEYDMAEMAPAITGSTEYYPDKGKPFSRPDYDREGSWGNIPEPTAKRIGVVVDIFKHLAGKHDQRSHSGKSSSHGGYQLNEPKNPQPSAGKYGEDSVQAAKAERARIAEIEPAMTREMIDIANAHGATMEGLDHRLKSDESLARKVDAEKDTDFGGDATKTAQSMSDVVRYTMTYPDAEYAGNVESTIADMEARGYKARVKNYWEMDDPYQGINVALTHPSGIKVELQFHTPRSVKVKETVHGLLDKFRAEPNARTRFALWDRMVRVSNQIPVPPPPEQLLSIGDLKSQTFALKMRATVQKLLKETNSGV